MRVGNGELLLPAPHRYNAGASFRAPVRFLHPLYHPGRRDFPGPVGSEDLSSWNLPVHSLFT